MTVSSVLLMTVGTNSLGDGVLAGFLVRVKEGVRHWRLCHHPKYLGMRGYNVRKTDFMGRARRIADVNLLVN